MTMWISAQRLKRAPTKQGGWARLREEVLQQDLCARCGLCEVVCPADIIDTASGVPKLRTTDERACGTCTDCLDICPGKKTEAWTAEQRLFGRGRKPEERWLGIVRRFVAGRAADPHVFAQSGSGGSVSALLASAMQVLDLDAVVVAGREHERPWRGAATIVADPNELSRHGQSTYQLFPQLRSLKQLFRDQPRARVGLVGLACQIQALRRLQARDSHWGEVARRQILFLAEIACSSNTKPEGTETFLTNTLGLELSDVTSVRYRTGDYPGEMQILTKDGQERRAPFWELVRHFREHKTHRCLSCPDWISGLADVSVWDGDPNIFAASQYGTDITKHGTIAVRTEVGEVVVSAAIRSGRLETLPHVFSDDNLGFLRKRNRRASYERGTRPIPDPPIPGYRESIDAVDDEVFVPKLQAGGERNRS